VNLGAMWIPVELVKEFISFPFARFRECRYSEFNPFLHWLHGSWNVREHL